jgi:hypothetical protein
MGLDFHNSDAHWSYSGFARFRERLAKHEGFDLDEMQGFNGLRPWSEITTALKPLLDHSDGDGELTPEECAQVAPRLREVLAGWEQDDYDTHSGRLLADGMEWCAANGEPLEFC